MKLRSRAGRRAVGALATAAALLAPPALSVPHGRAVAQGETAPAQGSVVFLHPDGAGPNHWGAGRIYWYGPDALSPWDRMPFQAVYRGHMADRITGTSNGGATTHAFGYKVEGGGSFGKDGEGDEARTIDSLSGYGGSILREAGAAGHPIGVVNDGNIGEPGTGAFLAEVDSRDDWNEIALQTLRGRPGTEDPQPQVIMGGGERNFLPDDRAGVHCPADRNTAEDDQMGRTDGRDLVQEASDLGYRVVRTRAELDALREQLDREPDYAPRVLGLFACHHTFNDTDEEDLIASGRVDPSVPVDSRESNLLLFGTAPGTPGYRPPTAGEMTSVALTILERVEGTTDKPFMLVAEPESTDNFANDNNAIGELVALRRANEAIEAVQTHIRANPDTLLLTAADSDASGMQLVSRDREDDGSLPTVGTEVVNPAAGQPDVEVPLDGLYGRDTVAFESAPDQFGQTLPFGVGWVGPDVAGGIVSRAEGLNAELLESRFSERFDNVDVYRLSHATLFGALLPYPEGERAPTRAPATP